MKKIALLMILITLFLFGCTKANSDNKTNTYFLSFSDDSISIKVGNEEELSYSCNFSDDLTWESSNEEIASVEDGFVKGIAAGTATITISINKDGNQLSDTINVTVVAKGPSTYNVTIEGKTYNLAAGKPVSALLTSIYGKTYLTMEGYAFDGWYIDRDFTVAYDITKNITSDVTLYPKYRKLNNILGTSLEINTILKYKSGTVSDLGNVFTVSPGYNGNLSSYNLSEYTILNISYNIENEKYMVNKICQGDYSVPFDGFLLGIKNSWTKCNEYLAKLVNGTMVNLNTYSINTATKIYFDRSMDKGNANIISTADIAASYCSAYDFTYGVTVYDKNGDTKAYPASTTKVITAIAALKYASLDDTYTIGDDLALTYTGSSPSVAGLKVGQVWTLRELLYATLLPSGNDAAYACACLTIDVLEPDNNYTAREKADKFAELMNEVAEECGATNSHFMVPDGNSYYKTNGTAYTPSLWDDRLTYHYTTANDMVKIAKYAFSIGEIAEVTNTTSISFKIESGESFSFSNTNGLINSSSSRYYEGACGLKTGTTTPAGGCLISAVEYDGRFIILAVLKSTSAGRYTDSHTVYDLIFGK